MVFESTSDLMAPYIKAIGGTTNRTEMVMRYIQMAHSTWVNSLMGKKAEKENSHSQRGTHMKGIFMIMK